jgi:hypothetical protein
MRSSFTGRPSRTSSRGFLAPFQMIHDNLQTCTTLLSYQPRISSKILEGAISTSAPQVLSVGNARMEPLIVCIYYVECTDVSFLIILTRIDMKQILAIAPVRHIEQRATSVWSPAIAEEVADAPPSSCEMCFMFSRSFPVDSQGAARRL